MRDPSDTKAAAGAAGASCSTGAGTPGAAGTTAAAGGEAASASGHDVLGAARQWLARDGKVALATVVDTWGSAPVPIGGQMAIATDGQFEGSVSGGCIEGEVITEAEDILGAAPGPGKVKTLEFGVADETAWSVGLPCGGRVRVFVERLSRDAGGLALLDKAVEARASRKGLVLETRLEDGTRRMFERGDTGVPDDIAGRFWSGKSSLREGPDGQVFVHALVPPARIIAIGATHITQLLSQFATIAGYEVIVIDPRTAFASPERFPGVRVMPEWPQDAIPKLGLDPYTALAVLAHVAHIDDEALKVALRQDCLYIGALGSSRNHAKRRERLMAAGLGEAELARIKSPIGVQIGAQTPAEIALSVMAEIVLAVRGPKHGGKSASKAAAA